MFNNRKQLNRKQTVRLMVGLTILAWATQTLLHQWGFGQVTPATQPSSSWTDERFVPGTERFARGATIEIRTEATIVGSEVKLKQVARWSEKDNDVFAPIADFVLARIAPDKPFRAITLDEIKQTLRDGGVNIVTLNFVGARSCTVARGDVEYDERVALNQWIDAKRAANPAENSDAPSTRPGDESAVAQSPISAETAPAQTTPAQLPPAVASQHSTQSEPKPSTPDRPVAVAGQDSFPTLRRLLIDDLAARLNLSPESLQVSFKPQDENLLNLPQAQFTFDVEPVRARNLGDVTWNVSIFSGNDRKRVSISANARAWQVEVVAVRNLSFRQIVSKEDVIERRTLIDRLPDDTILRIDQVIGQQSARELKPGTVLTARLVDPVQLVKVGQFVTVTLKQGSISVTTVVRALENGVYGQTIRVRNEATRDVYNITVTGAQMGEMVTNAVASIPRD